VITVYIPGLPQRDYEFRRGDAQIIHDEKGNAIVIDGGEPDLYKKLFTYCKNHGIRNVTYILTHWHIDHDTGLQAFLDVSGIFVDKIYCPPPSELKGLQEKGVSSDYNRACTRINNAKNLKKTIVYPTASTDLKIQVGDIKCTIWRRAANRGDYDDYEVNNTSMQTHFPEIGYVSGGDMINKGSFLSSHKNIFVIVMKGYHHGNGDGKDDIITLHNMGVQLYWYNDWEPKGVPIGGTGFSQWGAGKAKQYIPVVLRTDADIIMTADNGKLTITKGTSRWEYDIPYNKGHWEEYDQGWKYIQGDGSELKDGAYEIDGEWYIFDKDGYRMTGWVLYKDGNYRFCDPFMFKNQFIYRDGVPCCYVDEYGRRIDNKWYQIDSKWYSFDENGNMRKGWYDDPGLGLRYLEPTQGYMYVNTQANIDGKEYTFDGYGRVIEALSADAQIMRVIQIAENEVGYKEKASNKNLDSKTANAGSNNYTKYGRDMHSVYPKTMDFPAAWCDAFVDWCFYKAFGAENAQKVICGNFDDYTVNSAGFYKKAGRWYTSPKKGDQVFFKDSKGICHTGLVYNVDGSKVYTIEGNKSNEVRKCSYALSDSYIAGYGRPKYELVADVVPTKTIEELAREVIAGQWGTGATRQQLLTAAGYDYNSVQAKVNELLKR